MNTYTLYEEYRLIERNESEINVAWSGAHLLLFFLAFVFGSFCTFCFHMLMYLFDEKCVLFPKLLSLTSLRHNVIYEFIPNTKDQDHLPVDFLSTQWVEKSTCDLPTYVPLVSGIFGLVWTTMFLMCSTGGRTSGFHRPWRVLLPVFLFSLTMGILCIYSSTITHYGLQELCNKLGEITGSSGGCSYTVNAATLAYERSIRGVYQATRLTIITAWLHTACWILSAILALVRVFMVIDFQLVKINVNLRGDIDKMLQRHEQHIRTVSPDPDSENRDERGSMFHVRNNAKVRFRPKRKRKMSRKSRNQSGLEKKSFDVLFFSRNNPDASEYSLYSPPKTKGKKRTKKENIFIRSSTTLLKTIKTILKRHRQDKLTKDAATSSTMLESESSKDGLSAELSRKLYGLLDRHINKKYNRSSSTSLESTYSSDMSEEKHLIDKVMARRKFRPRLDLEIKEATAQISDIKPVDAQIELQDNIDKVSNSSISHNTELTIESESKQILEVFESEIEKNNPNGNYQPEDNEQEDNIEEIINEMVNTVLEMNEHSENITKITDIVESDDKREVNKDMISYIQSTVDEIIYEGLKKDNDSDKLSNIDSKIDSDRIVDEVYNVAEVEHVPPISKQTQMPPKPKQD